MRFLTLLVALLFAFVASAQQFLKCPPGQEKYYSVIEKVGKCGECCMEPKKYWIFKKFEKGLLKAEVDNQCETLGYPYYLRTETHGFLAIKMSLDLYADDPNNTEY